MGILFLPGRIYTEQDSSGMKKLDKNVYIW